MMTKNKYFLIIPTILIASIIVYFFFKKDKEVGISNKRIAEIFVLNTDTFVESKISGYKELNTLFIREATKVNFAINKVYKKASYSNNVGYIRILTLTQQENKCIGNFFELSNGMVTKKEVTFDSTHIGIFNSYCDDRFYHIKNGDSLSFINYSLLDIDGLSYNFFNVREDSFGSNIDSIQGHCGKVWINKYVAEMNYYLEKWNVP